MILASTSFDLLVAVVGIQAVAIVYMAVALARFHARLSVAEARLANGVRRSD